MSGRQKEPRITDPYTHPRRYVNLTVAAEYLNLGWRTVSALVDEGKIPASEFETPRGRCRKIRVADLLAYEESRRIAS